MQDHRIQQFNKTIQEAINSNEIWNIIKRLKSSENPKSSAIIGTQGVIFRPRDKAQPIADILQEHFKPNIPSQDNSTSSWHREVTVFVNSFLDSTPTT